MLKMENIEVQSDYILEKGNPANFDFGLSRTPYICENPIVKVDAYVNAKMLRNLRQKAVEMLNEARTKRVFPGLNKFNIKPHTPCPISQEKPSVETRQIHEEGDLPYTPTSEPILVKNLGALKELQGSNLCGDYNSLNIKNYLSEEYFLQNGISSFYKSPPPAFHTKHCLFAVACGCPCKGQRLELEDRYGKRHLVEADDMCRNSVIVG